MTMTGNAKRDNSYWLRRLEKDGHSALLKDVEAGKITVYRATQQAGYRRSGPKKPAALLSYHWSRACHAERKRFVVAHLKDLNRVMREVRGDLIELKAQKPSD